MDHREVRELLVDLRAGDLDQSTHEEVNLHVSECVACRAWLETHDLLASLAGVEEGLEHPESELLACFAVRPEAMDRAQSTVVRRHLESCSSCRREVDLLAGAVAEARPHSARHDYVTIQSPGRRWWYVAAAAVVGVIALRLFLPAERVNRRHADVQPNEAVIQAVESHQIGAVPAVENITGEEIHGTRLIEAKGGLTLIRVKISDGAKVTIYAGDGVAFGDGFQIGAGTTVAVGTGQSEAPAGDGVS
jgi:hypothetical protein